MLRLRRHESSSVVPAVITPPDTIIEAASSPLDPIERFLNAVEARLAAFPADVRQEIRQELRGHIGSLVTTHAELCETEAEAVDAALRQFGSAERIAQRFHCAWESTAAIESPQ